MCALECREEPRFFLLSVIDSADASILKAQIYEALRFFLEFPRVHWSGVW